jgi:CBS domain containing-hemolysin-like protein
MLTFILAVATALVFSFLCSISEAALLSLRHADIERLSKTRAGRILRHFKAEIDVPIASILILNTVANTAGAFFAGTSYGYVFDTASQWVFMIAFTVTILLAGEIVPKTLGVTHAGRLAVPVAVGVRVLVWALTPVLFLTRFVSGALRRGRQLPSTSIEEIRLLAALGRTEGAVTKRTQEIIEGAVALKELTAYDVMVPRNGVAFLSGERSLDQNLSVVKRTGHSRFPFTPNGNLDDVEGIVLTKDLMFELLETPGGLPWTSVVGPMVVVPAAMPLERLLKEFQEERRHMAIVVDEYGGTQGLITLEDVLEELVGEIEDESDRVERFIIRRPDGALVCRGWAETRRVFEELRLDDETVDAATIGGFVADLVGRMPQTGDEVEWIGHRFKVLRASPRRAERIEVRPVEPRPTGPPAPRDR